MSTRSYILAASALAIALPLQAQPAAAPDDKAADKQATIAIGELEQKIGGRTTLQLKFEGLTAEEASAALAKSSGLRFGPPLQSPFGRVVSVGPAGAGAAGQPEAPRYNAAVAKMDFWLGVRAWSRAEAARLQREREALQRRQNEEKQPPMPTPAQGQAVTPGAMQAWQAQIDAWVQRRAQQMQRFDFNRGVGVRFDPNVRAWNLSAGDDLATGRAVNSWPCLILATKFQRSQNLSVEENEPPQKPEPKAPEKAGDKAGAVQAGISNGTEAVEGGQLSDSLSLGLSVYLEPKLLERARVQLQVNEARDDAGEDLLPERAKGALQASVMRTKLAFYPSQSTGMENMVALRPRQSRGKKLALLRGVILIRYPLQIQEQEITDLSGPQAFGVSTGDLPAQGTFQPPHLENGQMRFGASLTLKSERGSRAVQGSWRNRARGPWASEGILGDLLLPDPSLYTFTDSQGRTWRSSARGMRAGMTGPDGKIVPLTSPPTPPPDNFTYTEERYGFLQLVSEGASRGQESTGMVYLSPEELAKVRFTRATFSTETDWRTLEVPFEFRDLPLPPR